MLHSSQTELKDKEDPSSLLDKSENLEDKLQNITTQLAEYKHKNIPSLTTPLQIRFIDLINQEAVCVLQMTDVESMKGAIKNCEYIVKHLSDIEKRKEESDWSTIQTSLNLLNDNNKMLYERLYQVYQEAKEAWVQLKSKKIKVKNKSITDQDVEDNVIDAYSANLHVLSEKRDRLLEKIQTSDDIKDYLLCMKINKKILDLIAIDGYVIDPDCYCRDEEERFLKNARAATDELNAFGRKSSEVLKYSIQVLAKKMSQQKEGEEQKNPSLKFSLADGNCHLAKRIIELEIHDKSSKQDVVIAALLAKEQCKQRDVGNLLTKHNANDVIFKLYIFMVLRKEKSKIKRVDNWQAAGIIFNILKNEGVIAGLESDSFSLSTKKISLINFGIMVAAIAKQAIICAKPKKKIVPVINQYCQTLESKAGSCSSQGKSLKDAGSGAKSPEGKSQNPGSGSGQKMSLIKDHLSENEKFIAAIIDNLQKLIPQDDEKDVPGYSSEQFIKEVKSECDVLVSSLSLSPKDKLELQLATVKLDPETQLHGDLEFVDTKMTRFLKKINSIVVRANTDNNLKKAIEIEKCQREQREIEFQEKLKNERKCKDKFQKAVDSIVLPLNKMIQGAKLTPSFGCENSVRLSFEGSSVVIFSHNDMFLNVEKIVLITALNEWFIKNGLGEDLNGTLILNTVRVLSISDINEIAESISRAQNLLNEKYNAQITTTIVLKVKGASGSEINSFDEKSIERKAIDQTEILDKNRVSDAAETEQMTHDMLERLLLPNDDDKPKESKIVPAGPHWDESSEHTETMHALAKLKPEYMRYSGFAGQFFSLLFTPSTASVAAVDNWRNVSAGMVLRDAFLASNIFESLSLKDFSFFSQSFPVADVRSASVSEQNEDPGLRSFAQKKQ